MKNNNLLVSIIVPVYNVQEYLWRCVKSIVDQTWENLEILLIDDGSTDKSGLLCDVYAKNDSRIRVIHKANGGLSDARNVGIDLAKGDFLYFVDSDDWIDMDTIECLVKLAIEQDADIVECGYRNIYLNRIEEESANTGELIVADGIYAMQCQLGWKFFKSVAWNKLYKKCIFEDGKRYPIGRYHEDEFFTHQAFYAAKKLVYIDVSKYNYVREREGSITGKISSNILDSCYAFRERVTFAEEQKITDLLDELRNAYCYILFDRLYRCFQAGIYDEKVKMFLFFLQQEKDTVMNWNIAIQYKRLYNILLESHEKFQEFFNNSEKMKSLEII